ncbi:mitochondrial carrier [Peniophora sp. CONT]|nr:mitochondrial carrier [Peniophora sp. CONT]
MDPFSAKMVAAAAGSTITALTMTPFDVVKTRLQTPRPALQSVSAPAPDVCCQPASANVPCVRGAPKLPQARYMSSLAASASRSLPEQVVCVWEGNVFRRERVNGFYDAVKHVWRAEGMKGLWKGAGTSLVIGVPSSTAYMLTYDYLVREALPPLFASSSTPTQQSAYIPLASGMLARTAISTVMSPLELVRTNLQSTPPSEHTPHTLRSVLASVRTLVAEHGVRYLWRGLGPTLSRDVPFSGVYWAGYEQCKRRLERAGYVGAPVAFASGACSGIFAALLTGPLDTLKTRQQAFVATAGKPQTMLVMARDIIRTEGAGALYAGLGPRIAKIAPACGIMIACFEGFGHALARKD